MDRKIVDEAELLLRRRLAVNVRRIRKKKGLTVKQAGERAELHWRLWQKIEAAQTNATMFSLVRLANALDADPKELLSAPPEDAPKIR